MKTRTYRLGIFYRKEQIMPVLRGNTTCIQVPRNKEKVRILAEESNKAWYKEFPSLVSLKAVSVLNLNTFYNRINILSFRAGCVYLALIDYT